MKKTIRKHKISKINTLSNKTTIKEWEDDRAGLANWNLDKRNYYY